MFPYVSSSVCLYVSFWNYKFTRAHRSAATRRFRTSCARRLGPILSNRVQKNLLYLFLSHLIFWLLHICALFLRLTGRIANVHLLLAVLYRGFSFYRMFLAAWFSISMKMYPNRFLVHK